MPDSAALSVLVLAWDEAAPTVRTVLEAAPTVGTLLVLLPPPLPAPPSQPAPSSPSSTAIPPAASVPAVAPASRPAASPPAEAPAPPAPTAPEATPAPAASPSVRLLHLVASELPATVRSGSFRVPAAPYLGATPTEAATLPAPSEQAAPASLPAPASPLPPVASSPAGQSATSAVPTAALATAAPSATPPLATAAPAGQVAAEPLAEAAFAANDILDPDPEQELHPGPQPQPTATTPADAPQLADSSLRAPRPTFGPFGNRLPQADTTPAAPAPAPLASPAPEDTPEELAASFAASVAAARQYTAPDLNSQVIRYARLAVPTALATSQYQVIYAPAWPTWLAALELRQRTHLPLVLHLPALAAGRQPADTAAGWPAELQRQVLRQADLVLVETYALARRLRRELGLLTAAVRVVPSHDAAAIARALRRATRLAR